jgi:hypothetical protein
MVSVAPLPGNSPQHSIYKRLGGPQSLSGRYEEEGNLLPLAGIDAGFLSHTACSLVAIPTTLHESELSVYLGTRH